MAEIEVGGASLCRMPLFGGIEAGGTKFVCAVGSNPDAGVLSRIELPTGTNPPQLMERIVEWFRAEQCMHGQLDAIGVATFGPVDLRQDSDSFGRIANTPKAGWTDADLLGPLRAAFPGTPLGIDTDVNGAALGEYRWGAARNLSDFVYITLGTGVGGGGMSGGKLLHGLVHPEIGHMRLPRLPGDEFLGTCPFHGDCWEGLCSGPAIEARTQSPVRDLSATHDAWQLQAKYVALALANIAYVISPQRIILGGSVSDAGRMGNREFLKLVREEIQKTLAGYIQSPSLCGEGINDYIVAPGLGVNAGVCGAFALAELAYHAPCSDRCLVEEAAR